MKRLPPKLTNLIHLKTEVDLFCLEDETFEEVSIGYASTVIDGHEKGLWPLGVIPSRLADLYLAVKKRR